jgi:tetratricopeptide (TPR) repeat protein
MSHDTTTPPRLTELLARYLDRQAEAQRLGAVAAEPEVTPYEAGPVQPVDAKLAWDEVQVALAFYGSAETRERPALPHWPVLVAQQEPVVALVFSLGNFPQLVRNFHLLLTGAADLAALRPTPGRPVDVPLLVEAADEAVRQHDFPQALLALGGLRLAKQFEAAERCAQALAAAVPELWRPGWENERAALAWHAGQPEEARQRWQHLPASAPVLFNRGLAELFLGQPAAAREPLEAAVAQLPRRSAWQHLGRLYLTLAQMRG